MDSIKSIPVKLANGTTIYLQVSRPASGAQKVANMGSLPFKQVCTSEK